MTCPAKRRTHDPNHITCISCEMNGEMTCQPAFVKLQAARAAKVKAMPCPTEEAEQVTVAAWLKRHRIRFHHSPNGGNRDRRKDPKTGRVFSVTAMKMKRMGTSNGFPDLTILDAPPMFPNAPGAMIEMKRLQGGVASDEQKDWIAYLKGRGWQVTVAHGADEAINFLQSLGYGI